jgi:diguanylate cyclase (GGDEF)-like protein
MRLAKWMTANPATVDSSAALVEGVRLMALRNIGALLVVNGDGLAGIFTERDLLKVLASDDADVLEKPISLFMTANPICAKADDDYNDVYMKMKVNNIRHIPILDGEQPVGIVSIRDLTHLYQNKLESDFQGARKQLEKLSELLGESDANRVLTLLQEIERYRELSLTDELTGLFNKRYFMARLKEEVARARRYKQCLSLIFCDIDHFKRINDTYGHSVGDCVLKEIGGILAGQIDELNVISRLRKSDIVARYGGEEFVVILPETDDSGSFMAAEKMRNAIEKHLFRVKGCEVKLTMSFGVAGLCLKGDDFKELISHADEAMYFAKSSGRNCVKVYPGR